MKIIIKGQEYSIQEIELKRYIKGINFVIRVLNSKDMTFSGNGRDFNSAFSDLVDNIEHYSE